MKMVFRSCSGHDVRSQIEVLILPVGSVCYVVLLNLVSLPRFINRLL